MKADNKAIVCQSKQHSLVFQYKDCKNGVNMNLCQFYLNKKEIKEKNKMWHMFCLVIQCLFLKTTSYSESYMINIRLTNPQRKNVDLKERFL